MVEPLTNVRDLSKLACGFMASKVLFAELKPGGLLILHDFMCDNTRSAPSSAALFFLQYPSSQPDAVSFLPAELAPMAARAGFQNIEDAVMIPEITMMITARKPETA